MYNAHLTRQFDLIPEKFLTEQIKIIGVGAIGSFTALSLAKMGFANIEVWDADVVSIENMNSQFFRFKDIDRPKVTALRELIEDFTNIKIKTNPFNYEKECLDGIIVSSVDSMKVRKQIWENHVGKNPNTKAIIDPRMSAESALIYVANPMTTKETYSKTFYTDEEAVQERCTAKATMYTVNLISGYVCKLIKDFLVKGECADNIQWSIKEDDLEISSEAKRKARLDARKEKPKYRIKSIDDLMRPEPPPYTTWGDQF